MQMKKMEPAQRTRARIAAQSKKDAAMGDNFRLWVESGVLAQDLVDWMGFESKKPLGSWVKDASRDMREPRLLLARLSQWIVAERGRQEGGGEMFHGVSVDDLKGSRDPMLGAAIFTSSNDSIAAVLARRIGSKIAENGADSEAWRSLAGSILSTGIDLQGLAAGACEPEWRANAINRELAESMAGCAGLRQNWPAPSIVDAWASLGADPNAVAGNDRGLKATPISMCLKNTACWRQLLPLINAGGVISAADAGGARRMVNAILADPMRSECAQKAAGALAILQASGDTLESFRSKRGDRFDVFAIGAIWNNPCPEMSKELAALGIRWSGLAIARAAESFALHLQKGRHPQGLIEAMDAVVESAIPCEFNKAWLDVVDSACNFKLRWGSVGEAAWGDKFAAWGRALGWSSSDFSTLIARWPALEKAPAMAAIHEAFQIEALVAEGPQAKQKRISL